MPTLLLVFVTQLEGVSPLPISGVQALQLFVLLLHVVVSQFVQPQYAFLLPLLLLYKLLPLLQDVSHLIGAILLLLPIAQVVTVLFFLLRSDDSLHFASLFLHVSSAFLFLHFPFPNFIFQPGDEPLLQQELQAEPAPHQLATVTLYASLLPQSSLQLCIQRLIYLVCLFLLQQAYSPLPPLLLQSVSIQLTVLLRVASLHPPVLFFSSLLLQYAPSRSSLLPLRAIVQAPLLPSPTSVVLQGAIVHVLLSQLTSTLASASSLKFPSP